jgi:hypothetical protein
MPGAVVSPSCGAYVDALENSPRTPTRVSLGVDLESAAAVQREYALLSRAKNDTCVACPPKPATSAWAGPGCDFVCSVSTLDLESTFGARAPVFSHAKCVWECHSPLDIVVMDNPKVNVEPGAFPLPQNATEASISR